jgi:uncharacterized protein YqcC (DUF446 family)
MNHYEKAAGYADRIEAELKQIGVWDSEPPPPAAFQSKKAFFGDTMSFYQWLQFVLLARVRDIVAQRGAFPKSSSVGAYAIRELDGQLEAAGLVSLLCEFDQFIER